MSLNPMLPAAFCSLAGKKAVVTGASTGIGRAIAIEFARAGAAVVVHCHRSLESGESTVRHCAQLGVASELVTADLADASSYQSVVDRIWNVFGSIDIWVNNAGVDLLTGANARLSYSEKLQKLFDVDVQSTVLLGHMVAERMSSGIGGSLVNIGWDQADRGMEGNSGELFATSKNAIMGFTRSLAVSFAPRVRVNCIAPGWIRTAWGDQAPPEWQQRVLNETPMKRWGTPQDIANLARFLCSDEAAYISGQIVNANGGAVR